MRTKAALPILVLLVLLLLGGAWAALRPEGSSLIPFFGSGGSSASGARVVGGKFDDEQTTAKNACSPANGEKSGVKVSTEPGDKPGEGGGVGAQATKPPADKGPSKPDAESAKPKPPVKAPDPAPKDPAIDAKPKPRAVIRGVRHPPNQSLGNVKPRARKLKEENGKKALDSVTPEIKQDRRGLLGRYYAFQSNPIDELADPNKPALESRTPGLTRIDQQVAFPSKGAFSDLPFELANFFVTWEGFLVVPVDGDYWLFLGADLGGRVVLDSETVLLNDMFSDYIEVSTVLTLTAGLH
ncbi:MAG: hypothetical protein KBG84_17055, partial [Planctomycetes bacterium]|nr:hypothetical protein [Planctomycetota bacterium]